MDVDWYEHLVVQYLPAMKDLRVACDASGVPIGFIAQDDGEIHMLFVDPDAQGRPFPILHLRRSRVSRRGGGSAPRAGPGPRRA